MKKLHNRYVLCRRKCRQLITKREYGCLIYALSHQPHEIVVTMKNGISLESVVVATKDQISCELGEEIVILNLASGNYYALSGVGVRVWNLIQHPKPIGKVLNTLLEEYEVEPLRCQEDLLVLLNGLEEKGLIDVKGTIGA